MTPKLTILEAIADPNILGDTLSTAQEAALAALYGLPQTAEQEAVARQCTGRAYRPGKEYSEGAFICGRRGGKSDKLAANIALFEAFFRDHNLSPGETGVVLLLAQNMRQAKVVRNYIEGKITKSPILSRHLAASRAQEIELDNRITIAIHPASFRSIRGLSVVCCICDEIAFWWTEEGYANPDTEVIRAARPAMATFPHAKLVLVSSPYAMTGVLWEMWRARHDEPETLVWHAPTRLMNPTVPRSFLEREKRRDPENFAREYEAEFTEAIRGFLHSEAIDACVRSADEPGDCPAPWQHRYVAAIDAAFKGDRFTFVVVHRDSAGGRVVVDHVQGWQGTRGSPIELREVLPQIRMVCDRYDIVALCGDQYGAAPIGQAMVQHGLRLKEVPFTQQSKADIYGTLRSLIVDRSIVLPPHPELLKELRQLELELMPGGAVRIGHPGRVGAHDDYADAVALAAWQAQRTRTPRVTFA